MFKEIEKRPKEQISKMAEREKEESARKYIESMPIDAIYDINTKGEEFSHSFGDVEKSITPLQLENSKIEEIKKEISFEEEMNKLRQQEVEARGRAMREISSQIDKKQELPISRRDFFKKTANLIGTAMLFESISPSESKGFFGGLFKKEKESLEDGYYKENIEKLMKELIDDKEERSFAFFADSLTTGFGRKKWVEYNGAGRQASVVIPIGLIKEELEKDSYGNVIIIHTHPLEAYGNTSALSWDKIDKIRQGEVEPSLMPPSFTDISELVREKEFFGDNLSKRVKSAVVDPAGIWSYSLDNKKNDFFVKWNEYIKICADYRQFLSNEEGEKIERFKQENKEIFKNLDSYTILTLAAGKDPEAYRILLKMEDESVKVAIRIMGQENVLFVDNMEEISNKIRKNIPQSSADRKKGDKDIASLINGWKEKGVNILYKRLLKSKK